MLAASKSWLWIICLPIYELKNHCHVGSVPGDARHAEGKVEGELRHVVPSRRSWPALLQGSEWPWQWTHQRSYLAAFCICCASIKSSQKVARVCPERILRRSTYGCQQCELIWPRRFSHNKACNLNLCLQKFYLCLGKIKTWPWDSSQNKLPIVFVK